MLVEVVESPTTVLPFEEGDFDLVLVDAVSAPVDDAPARDPAGAQAGGRWSCWCVRRRCPVRPRPPPCRPPPALHFKGARVLFERDGFGIVEALKGQTSI